MFRFNAYIYYLSLVSKWKSISWNLEFLRNRFVDIFENYIRQKQKQLMKLSLEFLAKRPAFINKDQISFWNFFFKIFLVITNICKFEPTKHRKLYKVLRLEKLFLTKKYMWFTFPRISAKRNWQFSNQDRHMCTQYIWEYNTDIQKLLEN